MPRGRQKGQILEKKKDIIVNLYGDYRIKIDAHNYILQEKIKSTSGLSDEEIQEGFKIIGYYGLHGFEAIMDKWIFSMVNNKLGKKTINSAEDFIDVFKKIKKEIEAQTNIIVKELNNITKIGD